MLYAERATFYKPLGELGASSRGESTSRDLQVVGLRLRLRDGLDELVARGHLAQQSGGERTSSRRMICT